jgi:glyoxylase-like metal-dependent hydrolase (beta-lactamase superfamily II)/8-oxo-dGTP pyrophosphatase MutT (NUDIX family)
MPRSSQLLHPQREPVATRPAATVLLLRDGPQGLEVLMTRRSMTASFAPGAYVFPGGVVDAADAQSHHLSTRRQRQSDAQLTDAIAAIRESYEELGVLLARGSDGGTVDQLDIDRLNRQQPFAEQCQALGLQLMGSEVFTLARWVTDRDMPKRFDVAFLVARMPQGQTPVADEAEQFAPEWVRPADALARHREGQFFMIFPTIRTLERLGAHADVEAVLTACAAFEEPLWTSCPRGGMLQGQIERFMESDHAFGELAMVCPDGQTLHVLDWGTQQPVRLLNNVMRLTAPNPGMMTGPGTNSYIVGTASTGYTVIDPGPDDAAHIQRLYDATGGDIRHIVCTHSHPDHSPGARPLQALCMATGRPKPLIRGLASLPTARPGSAFEPDQTLQNGELLVGTDIGQKQEIDQTSALAETHTLRAIHTPGHAANHLCLVLEEDALLFSGDHILNGSTTVVDPPDGNMGDYLASLDVLDAACAAGGIEFILPAHGHVLAPARAAIAHLKAHRLKREAKVEKAMKALPQGSMDDWVKIAYDDTPQQLWPIAKRSMLAHVEHLRSVHPELAKV